MKKYLLPILLLAVVATSLSFIIPPKEKKLVIGYVFGRRPIEPNAIDARHLTHINYAFAEIVNNEVVPSSDNQYDSWNVPVLMSLKQYNPQLKILISIGGWGGSKGFSDAALTPESRATFTRSAIAYLLRFGFDGIDIDWEYPGQLGDNNPFRPEDKQNFTLMLQSLREGLDSLSKATGKPDYLLTIAAGAGARFLEFTEMDKAQEYLDFINIMTYDFTGPYTPEAGHHSNLFPSTTGKGSFIDTEKSVALMRAQGIRPEKIVIGAAFYGKGWRMPDKTGNGLNQQAQSYYRGFNYTAIRDSLIPKAGYDRFWDKKAKAPYLFHRDSLIFVSYEDPKSIQSKMKFVHKEGLRGIMFWEYFGDNRQDLIKAMQQ